MIHVFSPDEDATPKLDITQSFKLDRNKISQMSEFPEIIEPHPGVNLNQRKISKIDNLIGYSSGDEGEESNMSRNTPIVSAA
jgi:hypothetical protein